MFEKMARGMSGMFAADRNEEEARKLRAQNLGILDSIDFEPEYASTYAPTYRKVESPVAGSYLESMLMGNSPDAVRSSAPGAAVQKAMRQGAQNRMFGTPEERVARQHEIDAATPWEVKAPTRKVRTEDDPAMFAALNPRYAELGIEKATHDAVVGADPGFDIEKNKLAAKLAPRYIENLIEDYGSEEAAREAITKYGGIKNARANAPGRAGKMRKKG